VEPEERDIVQRFLYRPEIDWEQVAAFDARLQHLPGSWTTIGRSFLHAGAPGVIRLRWIIPGERWCDEEGMLSFLDRRFHRQVLRWFLHSSPVTDTVQTAIREYSDEDFEIEEGSLRTIWNTDQLLQKMGNGRNLEQLTQALHFLTLQDYLLTHREGEWTSGPALSGIPNFGPTFEWIIQAHLQQSHHALARRCVHFKEWEAARLNDLDILAFTNKLVVIVECKSSPDIALDQIARFVKRAQRFPADLAILLIDTANTSNIIRQAEYIKSILGPAGSHFEERFLHEESLIVFLPENIYVANTADSIASTLEHILHVGLTRQSK
jgi:hypothetical protein